MVSENFAKGVMAPYFGEHNGEILTRLLGYSADEVLELHDEGVL